MNLPIHGRNRGKKMKKIFVVVLFGLFILVHAWMVSAGEKSSRQMSIPQTPEWTDSVPTRSSLR